MSLDRVFTWELHDLWLLMPGMPERTTIEAAIIKRALKGGSGSGNWGHAGRPPAHGGSSPGGGLQRLGVTPGSSVSSRRAASQRYQESREKDPWREQYGIASEEVDTTTEKAGDLLSDGIKGMDLYYREGGKQSDMWRYANVEQRAKAKDEIVTKLAQDAEVSYEDANAFVAQWSESSNDMDMRSLSIQQAAADEFRIPMSDWQRQNLRDVTDAADMRMQFLRGDNPGESDAALLPYLPAKYRPLMPMDTQRDLVRSMYDQTQTLLREKGFKPGDKIRLRRGGAFSSSVAGNLSKGDTVPIVGNAMESWSISERVATTFAFGASGDVAVVFEMDVPVEQIISTARTGFGCLTEGEFLVMGSIPGSRARVLRVDK